MFYIKLYRKPPNTFSFVSIKQVLFCKGGGCCFWDQFLGWGWLAPQRSSGGCPKSDDLAELRFLRGGGDWTKKDHQIFSGRGVWHPGGHYGDYFFWCNFSVKLPWLQRRGDKFYTTIFDRYYSQTCQAITFRRITNHTKYK